MKNIIAFGFIITILFCMLQVSSQTTVKAGDTIKLKTTNPEGRSFIWQTSGDSITWNDIKGSDNKTLYLYIVPSNPGNTSKLCFLARVSGVSTCKNFISNTQCLNLQLSPIINSTPALIDTGITSVTIQGNIIADNGFSITSRGICYNTTGTPTISDMVVLSGSGIGPFPVIISGLTANTKYYARIFASNSKGTTYSQQISFITKLN